MRFDVVLLSTADWDNPFWTNKQHVAVELAKLGHRVLYIDSLGLRRPSISKRDVARIARRFWKALRPPSKVRENLWIWSPIVLPWHGNRLVRSLNRILLRGGLSFWRYWLGLRADVLWTYNPLTTEFLDLNQFRSCVYHCVDEIKAQPGMPVSTLEKTEQFLVDEVDIVFTTSPHLTETRQQWNDRTYYLPNVADYEHFSKALLPETPVPSDLAGITGPRLGFIGAISGYKVDFSLLRELALSRPQWSIILIGAIGEGDPWTDERALEGLPNLHLLGPRDYQLLPGYLKGFDVALLPNMVNEYTDSMFPMKFFEYLAAGKPVVSVDLKAIRDFSSVVCLCRTLLEFESAIDQALCNEGSSLEQRLAIAQQYTYRARTARMLELLDEVMHGK